MSIDLYRLVYCSRNTTTSQHPGCAGQADAILARSRANNARHGVTGALLYSDGCFAQALEGPLDAVQQTFERIQRDFRHSDIVVLEAGRVAGRVFGTWSMAWAGAPDPASTGAVLSQAMAEPDGEAGANVLTLLKSLVRREAEWLPGAA